MVARYFTRPQARVFGVLVEGANVRCSATTRPLDRRRNNCALFRSQSSHITTTYTGIRPVATKSPLKSSGQSSPRTRRVDIELRKANGTLETDQVPTERAIIEALQICKDLARSLAEPIEPPKVPSESDQGPTSNLLSLEEGRTTSKNHVPSQAPLTRPIRTESVERISQAAFNIITDPKVFITPIILATYVQTQAILGRPESLPQTFELFASKPIPIPNTNPIQYKPAIPNRAASAIPLVLAHTALTAAIHAKELPLALDIIDCSVCTAAYKRNKLIRKALLPFSAFAMTPPAAYVLARQFAEYQNSMDPQLVTNIAFAGMIAYVGFTATIGIVAVTTANDQMDRITWARGTPLRERWLREDERALVDRVAGAWGFQDIYMRGEEEGPEWEALREWAGQRKMVLDSPELMEGME